MRNFSWMMYHKMKKIGHIILKFSLHCDVSVLYWFVNKLFCSLSNASDQFDFLGRFGSDKYACLAVMKLDAPLLFDPSAELDIARHGRRIKILSHGNDLKLVFTVGKAAIKAIGADRIAGLLSVKSESISNLLSVEINLRCTSKALKFYKFIACRIGDFRNVLRRDLLLGASVFCYKTEIILIILSF